MRRILSLILIITISLSLISCSESGDPYLLLCDFVKAYGAEGTVYSPHISEGQEGYIPPGLINKIYRFSGDFPQDYAIFLNSRPEAGGECGLFICEDADMLSMMEQVCLERIRLLDSGMKKSFVKIKGKKIFYSTMSDRELADRLSKEILR